jgi:uncharacterized protein
MDAMMSGIFDEAGEAAHSCASMILLPSRGLGGRSQNHGYRIMGVVTFPRSHVLTAMGLPENQVKGALRLSWCHLTPEVDWVEVVSAIRKLKYNVETVQEFCRKRGIARLELFGSALGDKFTERSDVDLLATLRPGVRCGLFEWVSLQEDLASLFGRPVDLISRRAVERSRNEYRKNAILSKTPLIYAEG